MTTLSRTWWGRSTTAWRTKNWRCAGQQGGTAVQEQYVITAGSATAVTVAKEQSDRFYAKLTGKGEQGVRVDVLRDGQLQESYAGHSAVVTPTWSRLTCMSLVSIRMDGPVVRTSPHDPQPERRSAFEVGQLPIPAKIEQVVAPLSVEEIYRNGENYTTNIAILAEIRDIPNQEAGIRNEIKAELNGRIAFSLSCFLLVALGAALGLISRGGQFVSAFAVGALPGMAVVIAIFVGRNMAEGTKSTGNWGLALIWGSMALLLAGTMLIYGWLVRR